MPVHVFGAAGHPNGLALITCNKLASNSLVRAPDLGAPREHHIGEAQDAVLPSAPSCRPTACSSPCRLPIFSQPQPMGAGGVAAWGCGCPCCSSCCCWTSCGWMPAGEGVGQGGDHQAPVLTDQPCDLLLLCCQVL